MPKITFDITIEASTKEEAVSKMKSLVTLCSRLKTKELGKLAHIVEHDPKTLSIAKAALGLGS
jgi:hypothetical protein